MHVKCEKHKKKKMKKKKEREIGREEKKEIDTRMRRKGCGPAARGRAPRNANRGSKEQMGNKNTHEQPK